MYVCICTNQKTQDKLRDFCVWIYKTHVLIVAYLWIMLHAFVNNIETNLSPYDRVIAII